jgi:hypothetical protein
MPSLLQPSCHLFPHLLTNKNVLSIFGLFNDFSRNDLDQKLFPNQALLSHASTVGMTYKGVAPLHMARLKAWRMPDR